MSTVLSSKDGVRAQRKYRCCLCGEHIEAGELYDVRRGVSDDGHWTMQMHPECHAHEQEPGTVEPEWYEDVSEPAFARPMTAFDPAI